MAISYKRLGLVNTREMFKKAMIGRYAVPAYNFNNMEQLQAIITACIQTNSPVILQVSKGARKYASQILLRFMAMGAIEIIKNSSSKIPVALHLDHGDSYELCVSCIETGFSSVMIDGSGLGLEDNIALTRKVVDYAHKYDVTVEGELGVLAGIEEEVGHEKTHYTRPEEVQKFVSETGVDSLAISIGTSHGAYKFKIEPDRPFPELRFDILEEIENMIPDFPIVLHGASSVPGQYVDIINKFGGKLGRTTGVPEEQLRRAARSAVCKINIDTDGRLAVTAKIREIFAHFPEEFDPRKYLGPAREELVKMYKHKNEHVLGSAGKA